MLFPLSPEAALAIAIGCAYLAALVYALWPTGHLCHDQFCRRDRDELKK